MDFETFKKEVATKDFNDVLKMIKESHVYPIYKSLVEEGCDSERTNSFLRSSHMLNVISDSKVGAIIKSVSIDLLYEKANKQLRREILGKKKEKVVKKEVEDMIIDCFKTFHNHDKLSDFMDDILDKLKEM